VATADPRRAGGGQALPAGRPLLPEPRAAPDPPELSALHRAAPTLARQGKATLAVLWSEYPGRRLVTVIGPPGCTVNGVPLPELSVDHGPGGTRSAFKGSLRDLAREEGVSVATARRDLAEAGRPAGGRRGGTGGKGKGD